MNIAKFVYKGKSGSLSLSMSDFEERQINSLGSMLAEDLIEIVCSKLESKNVNIVYEIKSRARVGERNRVPDSQTLAEAHDFSELSLFEHGQCVLHVL
ncbi:hypothetical protein [Psychrobium sp. 1_MG-2023]|uniref:hypothetical protein n=1 Tax=Psychrobium sp. 1_MG-2023 TaxID=3062624 RepID=UPI000C33AA34|nr:hypothetical protein [Psychrobium sp. 1_MG-2023]MDP2561743.1 hypothetical protein [Psychrobium sp. 1_MG-2023]PKF59768.1 hypothetical protein CW748_00795 [Alteromonadales bacterium alter-6D02]